MSQCFLCKDFVGNLDVTELVYTWEKMVDPTSQVTTLREVTWHKACYSAPRKLYNEAISLLLDMVNQYCAKTVRESNTPQSYSHDFMSTGEDVFEFLVDHGLAEWCENGFDIKNLVYPKEVDR